MRKLLSLLLLLAATITASAENWQTIASYTYAAGDATGTPNPTGAIVTLKAGGETAASGSLPVTYKIAGDLAATNNKYIQLTLTGDEALKAGDKITMSGYCGSSNKGGFALGKQKTSADETTSNTTVGKNTLFTHTVVLSTTSALVGATDIYLSRNLTSMFFSSITIERDLDKKDVQSTTSTVASVKIGDDDLNIATALNGDAHSATSAAQYTGLQTVTFNFTNHITYTDNTTEDVSESHDAKMTCADDGTITAAITFNSVDYNVTFTGVDYKTIYTLAGDQATLDLNDEAIMTGQGYIVLNPATSWDSNKKYYNMADGRTMTIKVSGVAAFGINFTTDYTDRYYKVTVDGTEIATGVVANKTEAKYNTGNTGTATIVIAGMKVDDKGGSIYPDNLVLYATAPATTQSITLDGQYGTAVATQDLDFSQAQVAAYVLSAINDGTLTLTKVDAVKKGDAFLARGAAGSYNIPAATTTPTDTNLFLAGAGAAVSGACALTGNDTDGYCFAPCAATTAVPEGKAYFVPAAGQAAARYTFDFGTTAISALAAATQAAAPVKRIVNGQILIGNYNALGQQVR